MTTEKEHAAMRAAGMTDQELSEWITTLTVAHRVDDRVLLLRACQDEWEARQAARFSNEIDRKKNPR